MYDTSRDSNTKVYYVLTKHRSSKLHDEKKRKWVIDKMEVKKIDVGYFEKLNQLSLDMSIEVEARSPNLSGPINY